MDAGARGMLEQQWDEFYYITVMNENYAQPTLIEGSEAGILKGLYRFAQRSPEKSTGLEVRLLGSGAILNEVLAAADLLAEEFGVTCDIFSATSFSELARDAARVSRQRRLGGDPSLQSHVESLLAGNAPVIAATDYVRAYPQLIAPYVQAPFVALGTDGFGRSDTRAALRRFFEVDRHSVVLAALEALVAAGSLPHAILQAAVARFGISAQAPAPWTV